MFLILEWIKHKSLKLKNNEILKYILIKGQSKMFLCMCISVPATLPFKL